MPRAGLTTDKVARAGAELADEVGFGQVTISELARRLGVKVASLYSHVQSSDDLRTRIALIALEELADRGDEALAGRSGRDALIALGEVYRTYASEHPGRYDAAGFPLDAATAAASAGPRHSRMLRATLRAYRIPEPAQTHAVRLVGSVVHGFVTLERSGGFAHSEPDSGQSWTSIMDALDTMLRTWSAA
ncbi:TetR/AcrR family transcriptional regulator [Aeromicrobium chenweiae]|uniref:TetR family transcriptional regulator n=1 Tax=Aeromicrobium chenweiae TaxID=2079793 RepID=A0A2S0WP75_9ACTN|nr:TetR/AcrR family transcriptional regulator [Aeromicrobium chenweiae]AWB93111.1 TetR family transcriptional regulator [Aeromicrobium chenweiae]TGN34099.1 TetR/AcrR family transcriptional regulator [Aeromicrobium chenweiae]